MNAGRCIAHSRPLPALLAQVRPFAATDSTVLISGETGTGKNAVARELPTRGPRAKQPFVTVDCAALAGSLIDPEPFGHGRGAFTDASAHRRTLDEVERRYVAATLNHIRGNQTEAATLLGISRKALWEKRKRYCLE